MPALIDLRRRIRSVRNTQQVTKAMKTVATAKYKKTHRAVIEGRPFWHAGPGLVARFAQWAGPGAHPLFESRRERRFHVLVITTDKGLCGAFNSNLLAEVHAFLAGKAPAEPRLVLIGKKAANHFRRQPWPIERAVVEHSDRLGTEFLRDLARDLMRAFLLRQTDAVYLAHNEFRSILAPRILITKILPATRGLELAGYAAAGGVAGPAPLHTYAPPPVSPEPGFPPGWTPDAAAALEGFVPRQVEERLLHAYAESQAAEQAARMMAMESASQNAEELIGDLTLVLNKIRQSGITKELLEIMTAVEALKPQ